MSARVTASGVQICLHASIVALVERLGTGRAAGECGIDPSSVRRHKVAGGWSDAEISALIAFEFQEAGSSTILSALVGTTNDERRRGDSVRLHTDLVRELDDDAVVDRAILKNLDRSTPDGRRAVRDAIALRRQHEDELLADMEAQDRTAGGPR